MPVFLLGALLGAVVVAAARAIEEDDDDDEADHDEGPQERVQLLDAAERHGGGEGGGANTALDPLARQRWKARERVDGRQENWRAILLFSPPVRQGRIMVILTADDRAPAAIPAGARRRAIFTDNCEH